MLISIKTLIQVTVLWEWESPLKINKYEWKSKYSHFSLISLLFLLIFSKMWPGNPISLENMTVLCDFIWISTIWLVLKHDFQKQVWKSTPKYTVMSKSYKKKKVWDPAKIYKKILQIQICHQFNSNWKTVMNCHESVLNVNIFFVCEIQPVRRFIKHLLSGSVSSFIYLKQLFLHTLQAWLHNFPQNYRTNQSDASKHLSCIDVFF